MALNDTINMWQHYAGDYLAGDSVMGISTNEFLIDHLREHIANGDYLFESTDPDEGLRYFDQWCANYLRWNYDETGEFSEDELEGISEHLWNGNVRFAD